jgi:hypothetical protein
MATRRRIVSLILAVAAGILAFEFVPKPLPELSQQELIAEVQSGNVHQVVIVDKEVLTAVSTARGEFRVDLRHSDPDLITRLTAMGVDVKFETTPLGLI